MNNFKITVVDVQHIKTLEYAIDLTGNKIICIVGKNGVGKTTLIKSIGNYKSADTFEKTSNPYIFTQNSTINYEIDNNTYKFSTIEVDGKFVLDTKDSLDNKVKNNISIELPIPYGERFKFFQNLGTLDEDLRSAISTKSFQEPDELIALLHSVYKDNRFQSLKEVKLKNKKYYFILQDNDYYIREDYFSSGEYFVISIYKLLQSKCRLIVIDEIDISLDSSAQVELIDKLRELVTTYNSNIVFTTHSLAIMKKIHTNELFYMEKNGDTIEIELKSYNYIKSLLFQFDGFEKCILTEDKMLQNYIEFILKNENIFHKYKIIYIGGSGNVIKLMNRNKTENFFGDSAVCSILDGDQKETYLGNENVIFLPFVSIEKYLYEMYKDGLLSGYITGNLNTESITKATSLKKKASAFYNEFTGRKYMDDIKIFNLINTQNTSGVEAFKLSILEFLS